MKKKNKLTTLLVSGLLLSACATGTNLSNEQDENVEPQKDELVAKFKKEMDQSKEKAEETKDEKEETKDEDNEETKEEKVEVAKEEKGVSTSSEEKNNNKQAEPKEEPKPKEEKVEVTKEEKGGSTSSEEKNNNKQAEPKEEPKSYTESEIIKLVLSGDFGNGSERKRNVEKHGFNYNEIQAKINKDHAPKPKEEPKPSSGSGSGSTTQYAPNRIYIKGSSMPIRNEPSIANLQEKVDNVGYTWISYGQYSPNDNSGTWFGAHRNLGGSVLLNVQVGENIIVTDSNGNPHTYRVNHRYIENKAEVFDDELAGRLPREYIVVQTSEPRVNGKRNGNRHVIAYKVN